MTADDLVIEAHGLVKHFGRTKALQGIDLAVARGTVLGVLGPNGCLLYTSPSPRDRQKSRMPSSA